MVSLLLYIPQDIHKDLIEKLMVRHIKSFGVQIPPFLKRGELQFGVLVDKNLARYNLDSPGERAPAYTRFHEPNL